MLLQSAADVSNLPTVRRRMPLKNMECRLNTSRRAKLERPELLTHRDAVCLLVETGLLTPGDVIVGQLEVDRTDRRNCNFRVRLADRPGFLIKQARTPESAITLRNEAHVLDAARCGELSCDVPRFHHYDSRRNVLIMELLRGQSIGRGSDPMNELNQRRMGSLGKALAVIHGNAPSRVHSERHAPLGFLLHRPHLDLFRDSSRANKQLIAAIQSHRGLCDQISAISSSWNASAFIHGDLKFDNVLIVERNGVADLVLVDWEFAGRGDPRWDVGSVLGELLYFWLVDAVRGELSAGASSDVQPSEHQTFDKVRLFVSALFDDYCAAAHKPIADSFKAACFGFSAARLLQSAYEAQQFRSEPDLYAVSAVQMAANIVADCDIAVELFLNHGPVHE
jgi:aminoglycoside phosphotransferase (APT) family kinase protein